MNLRRLTVTALVLGAAVLALAGCSKSTAPVSSASLDDAPPSAPSSVVGLYDPSHVQDYLIWDASTSSKVTGYQVWQYDANPLSGSSGTLVATVSTGSTFLGLPVPTQNSLQYFRVRTVGFKGAFSAFSASIPVQRHGAPVEPVTGAPSGSDDPMPGIVAK